VCWEFIGTFSQPKNQETIKRTAQKRKEFFHDKGAGFEREFSEEREHGNSSETGPDGG
jgi:hypothetical protein